MMKQNLLNITLSYVFDFFQNRNFFKDLKNKTKIIKMASKFGFETTALEVVEGIDLKGKEVIVTGASAGIGIETARALAKAGARVVLGVRNLEKAEPVAKDIRESTKNPNVEVEKLDLGSLASVNEFVKRYLEKKRPLNILINNAGVSAGSKSYTVDGFETDFGTNHIGHFALTIGLIPALIEGYKQSGKKSRVVNVASLVHISSDVVFDDINFKNRQWDVTPAYGQSKTANILFSVALNHLYSDKGIVSNALMPGNYFDRIILNTYYN
jgi:NAD(P)-dependent dehydrogenase (short-subunit alcohol dehydrogenase family)